MTGHPHYLEQQEYSTKDPPHELTLFIIINCNNYTTRNHINLTSVAVQ